MLCLSTAPTWSELEKGWWHFQRWRLFRCVCEHQRALKCIPEHTKTHFYIKWMILGVKIKLLRNGCTLDFFFFIQDVFPAPLYIQLTLSTSTTTSLSTLPPSPSTQNSSWGLIYLDIWHDLILMPAKKLLKKKTKTKTPKKTTTFWNAWAVRSNWWDSGKQKEQANKQTKIKECPDRVWVCSQQSQRAEDKRQTGRRLFFFLIRTCDFNQSKRR